MGLFRTKYDEPRNLIFQQLAGVVKVVCLWHKAFPIKIQNLGDWEVESGTSSQAD